VGTPVIGTRILRVDLDGERDASIRQAAAILAAGGLVVHPTETVYGIAVDPWNEAALRKLRDLKARDAGGGFILLVSSVEEASGLVSLGTPIPWRQVALEFWPGPLTLILPRGSAAPHLAGDVKGGIALRWTADPVAASLVRAARKPLTSTSANRRGSPPAVSGAEAARILAGRVDLVLEAGPRASGVSSTILDLTAAVPEIVREGAISRAQVEACLQRVKIHGRTGGRRT